LAEADTQQADKAQQAFEKMLRVAKDAGCPRDQVEQFLKHGYLPLPWQWNFHGACRHADQENGPVDVGVGGARGPGKSHAVLAQIALDDCQRVGNLKVLFLRQTGISAKESFEDLIYKVIHGRMDYTYNRANNTLHFPNGSKILLGGFKDDKDIDKYIGIEYDLIAIEEINQLTEDKIIRLRGSLRTSKPNWRPRMYTSFNPGGIGHQYVKDRYVTPQRIALEKETRFIPSTYKDNKFINKEYVDYLESLQGDLGKAWREGEWDLFAGQFFTDFRYDIHISEPYDIPREWKRFIMGDYGYGAPSAVYWGAVSPDSRLVLYREFYGPNYTYSQLTDAIIAMTPDSERLDHWVFDPAIWARKGETDTGLSGADIMQSRFREVMREKNKTIPVELPSLPTEIILKKANNERIIGWQRVRDYLKPYQLNDRTVAKLQIFSSCPNLIRTLPMMVYDTKRVEDLDTTLEDHAVDALRYGIMSDPSPYETRSKLEDRFFKLRMRAKMDRDKDKRGKLRSFYG
jgi:phage terminase large subunit